MRDWLSHRAEIEPDEEALVHAAAGDGYTFGHLDTLVDDIAGRLAAYGVERGEHLGVVLRSRLEYVCLVHAAMRLGVTLVPMGDGLTPRELAKQFETADVTTVVCGDSTESVVVDAAARIGGDGEDAGESAAEGDDAAPTAETDGSTADDPGDVALSVLTVDDSLTGVSAPLDEATIEPVAPAEWSLDDVQLVLFTSGTTGDPKAVQLTTGNLLASAVASVFRLGLDPDERWLATLSLHHMGGIAPILRMPLYGMTIVFREGFDAGGAADDIERYDATAVSLVPTMLRRMLDRRGTLSDSLRVVLLGGAPATPDLIDRCHDYAIPVHPTYGMTETASQIATARPAEAFENPDCVGRPLFLTAVTAVDEAGAPLPAGEPGELVVDGPTVTPGYYGDAEATADAFGEYGLHTGDIGVVDESGSLAVLNRVDDRIVTGGENVDPGEVVDVLTSHPDVREAAVVGVPDAEWGERVSALVVPERTDANHETADEPSESVGIGRSALIDFARDRLADFKLPKTIAFAESLPRTVSGTVDRETVRETFAGGQAGASDADRERVSDGRDGRGSEDRSAGDAADDADVSDDFDVDAGADAGETADADTDDGADADATDVDPDRDDIDADAEDVETAPSDDVGGFEFDGDSDATDSAHSDSSDNSVDPVDSDDSDDSDGSADSADSDGPNDSADSDSSDDFTDTTDSGESAGAGDAAGGKE
jgi:O-succinylbenzoic acid--CoA ligase